MHPSRGFKIQDSSCVPSGWRSVGLSVRNANFSKCNPTILFTLCKIKEDLQTPRKCADWCIWWCILGLCPNLSQYGHRQLSRDLILWSFVFCISYKVSFHQKVLNCFREQFQRGKFVDWRVHHWTYQTNIWDNELDILIVLLNLFSKTKFYKQIYQICKQIFNIDM